MPTDFNPSAPTGAVRLDIDYQTLQKNNQQLDTTFGVDHVAFSVSENNGYHKTVHMVHATSTPSAVSGTGEIYTRKINDGYADRGQFFFKNDSSQVVQFTRNFSPDINSNGKSYIAGGLVLFWGFVAITSDGTVQVDFSPAFPNALFHVFLTPRLNGAADASRMLFGAFDLTTSSFKLTVNTTTGKLSGMSFLAIGN